MHSGSIEYPQSWWYYQRNVWTPAHLPNLVVAEGALSEPCRNFQAFSDTSSIIFQYSQTLNGTTRSGLQLLQKVQQKMFGRSKARCQTLRAMRGCRERVRNCSSQKAIVSNIAFLQDSSPAAKARRSFNRLQADRLDSVSDLTADAPKRSRGQRNGAAANRLSSGRDVVFEPTGRAFMSPASPATHETSVPASGMRSHAEVDNDFAETRQSGMTSPLTEVYGIPQHDERPSDPSEKNLESPVLPLFTSSALLQQAGSSQDYARTSHIAAPSSTNLAPVMTVHPLNAAEDNKSIGDITLSNADVTSLFAHFDEIYAPQLPLPIFGLRLSSDQYYHRCPLLFWAIVVVASRTWPRDPFLFKTLSDTVRDAALMSIHQRNVDVVQALVLLLTWPLREEIANDSTLPLAAAMIMMARRAGLHRPAFGNEFVRARKGVLSQNDIISRTVLWAYCLISYRKCAMTSMP
jgi:hypothetical protein